MDCKDVKGLDAEARVTRGERDMVRGHWRP